MLTDAQVERYSRQIILPEVGARGQERLLAARVAVHGDGAAATTAATLLGRAGIGALEVSEDVVALPDLSPDCRLSRGDGSAADVAVVLLTWDRHAGEDVYGTCSYDLGTPTVLGIVVGSRLVVGTLLCRSCLSCFHGTWPLPDRDPLADTAAPAARTMLGALAANEALRVLVTAPTKSRLTILDVERGTAVVREIEPVGCRLCKAPA
jgi:hypothetical protein